MNINRIKKLIKKYFFFNSPKIGSYEYRRNRSKIIRGDVPEKYTRLVAHIEGDRVLEMGAAEGVLSLLLAKEGKKVCGIDGSESRHSAALRLQEEWLRQGLPVGECEFVLGDIKDNLNLLNNVDTFVSVRAIYYLQDDLFRVMSEVGQKVQRIVLCGKKSRADNYENSKLSGVSSIVGDYEYYATLEGMTSLVEEIGFTVVECVPEGDPIVVGIRDK